MKSYPHVAARVFNTPLLLLPSRAETIADVLAERLGHDLLDEAFKPQAFVVEDDGGIEGAPYVVQDGVALISVVGETVNRGSWLTTFSGLSSYQGISDTLSQAAADDAVTGILLDIDSPGGEASGAMELAAHVRKVNAVKPVTAFVDGVAASAGYAIASGAGKIVAMPSAALGSIGVVMLHIDRSARMARDGLKPTLLRAGAYKTDGTSMEPLGDAAQARMQGLIDVIYGLFTSTVAQHRASLNEDAIRATEAGLYIGQDAVAAGLADMIGTRSDAFATIPKLTSARVSRLPVFGANMPISQEDHDAALAAAKAQHDTGLASAVASAHDEGHAKGLQAGAAAERARVAGILGSDEAKGREASARHLALNTALDIDTAKGALVGLATVQPSAASTGLRSEMSAIPQANIGAGGQQTEHVDPNSSAAKSAEGAATAARLLGKKPAV